MNIEKPRVDLRQCDDVLSVRSADQDTSERSFLLKRVPALMTGSPTDTNVPFSVTKCDECGHVNKGFNPFDDEPKTITND
jgi:hypothetical protein